MSYFSKFDDRYLELFKRAGFYHFALGVESGSNKTLASINKQITTDQIFDVIDALVKHKFQSTYNFIAGFPNETIEDYKETLRTIYHIFEKCKYMVYPVPARLFTVLCQEQKVLMMLWLWDIKFLKVLKNGQMLIII